MLQIIDRAAITTGTTNSRIGFATEGGGAHKIWDRYLTVDGKRAYHLGNICQTCRFLFERLDGANKSINIDSAVDALASGIRGISDPTVAQLGMGLPSDDYVVCLSETTLQLVLPGQQDDYFVKEQTALWGIDGFWDLPHDPRVPYYRAGEVSLRKGAKLFHFVIPMFPENWLDKKVVSEYVRQIDDGGMPTAVAISLLDVKGPADWEGEIDPTEHWILSHFLIDGHHKVCAARQSGRPVRLLSFISSTHGISTREQIERTVDAAFGSLERE
ncbi:MAG TPA: hypothetical protein VMG82_25425 [Candidatus Sulfotelmatobacter sp.]|nr:hypothetical protein [Candidatus Sulfotelmatobacter sp.]